MKKKIIKTNLLFLAILLVCFFTACDRKTTNPPEASSHVTEAEETQIKAESLKQQGGTKSSALPLQDHPVMVFVEGGVFNFHEKQVEVDGFYISKYELTNQVIRRCQLWAIQNNIQEETYYYNIISTADDEPNLCGWYDALYICNLLSMQGGYRPVYYLDHNMKIALTLNDIFTIEGNIYLDFFIDNTADGYRLPTEVEWEYAARGGNKNCGYIYSGSDIPEEVAWFSRSLYEERSFFPIGSKKENELGLHDMSGNAHEWCIDYWSDKPLVDRSLRNEKYFYEANKLTEFRVIKGGFNYDSNGTYKESIVDYLRWDSRLNLDILQNRYWVDESGLSDNVIVKRNEPCVSGIRLVRKKQE
jgi:formylglycine-generating enzyme required for sulfatase activity